MTKELLSQSKVSVIILYETPFREKDKDYAIANFMAMPTSNKWGSPTLIPIQKILFRCGVIALEHAHIPISDVEFISFSVRTAKHTYISVKHIRLRDKYKQIEIEMNKEIDIY